MVNNITSQSNQQAHDWGFCSMPKFFNAASFFLLGVLTSVNTVLAHSGINGFLQLSVICVSYCTWFFIFGRTFSALVFSSVALMPSTLLLGVGYIKLPGMAISMTDLLISAFLFRTALRTPHRFRFSLNAILLWCLLLVCAMTILSARSPTAHLGIFVRLCVMVSFLSIVLSDSRNRLQHSAVLGMMVWPFTAVAQLVGLGLFWRFISFENFAALNLWGAKLPLVGSHQVVVHLIFLIPLLLFFKFNRGIILITAMWLSVLIVAAQSRSLIVAAAVAFFAYYFSIKLRIEHIFRHIALWALVATIAVLILAMGFFSFSVFEGPKASSSQIRIIKAIKVWETFTDNPFLGVGYGAVGAIDIPNTASAVEATAPDYFTKITNIQASAEFTPLQILAETGLVGGVVVAIMMLIYVLNVKRMLQANTTAMSLKLVLLCSLVVFLTGMLGSNFYDSFAFWTSVPGLVIGNRLARDTLWQR